MFQSRKKEPNKWKKEPYRPPEPIELRPQRAESVNARLDDLRGMVRQFICLFPYPTHLDIKVNNWSAALKDFRADSIRRVFNFYQNQPGMECPTIGDILGDLREFESAKREDKKDFPLPEHPCTAVEKPQSYALSMLAAVDPYAATHVACDCPGTPVCPRCGMKVEASLNPVVANLMARHPQDTVGWKPQRKGYYLCPRCRAEQN